ncbi:CoA-binding protein [Chloroflexota bacterium]
MKLDFSKLDRAFKPKTLAIVGDRPDGLWFPMTKDFKGKRYSVQVNPETAKAIEAAGIENYPNLVDIPGPVDLVIVSAPRAAALQIVDDCIRKDVGAVHMFTAGFSETNSEEWTKVEQQIAEKAKAANLHLIGPNCMGIYSPSVGIGQNVWEYDGTSEPIGIISQSGTHTTTFGQLSHFQGMNMNISVSFGNGIVLDSADYLEYFDYNPEIKVIGMYIEGIKDGRKFLKVLKDVSSRKPVVIWKGGRTEGGERAIASHTGSLAVSGAVWNAALKQCGAVKVDGVEELIDTMKALLYLPPVFGNRVGIVGSSGGQSVSIADAFAEAGFSVPKPGKESYKELDEFFSLIGGGYANPIDTGTANRQQIQRIMDILERDPNIDNLVLLTGARWGKIFTPESDFGLMAKLHKKTTKPVVAIVAFSTAEEMKRTRDDTKRFQESGVPGFPTIERGARALWNAYQYYRNKEG